MPKIIRYDKKAEKEIKKFPVLVQAKIEARAHILARDGKLEEPFGKRLTEDLFEMRIRFQGQWRIVYAYLVDNYIIVLSAFHKKDQKTPLKELKTAEQRLKGYKI